METVIVEISETGVVKVEAQGVRGQGCAKLTEAIEKAIGSTTCDVKKPEYHQAASINEANRAQHRQ